jgi:hypothetical protein|tara:strand:+ start:213 stop:644 length:432 start_codon:yes stop_codon:yes gene_type:complete
MVSISKIKAFLDSMYGFDVLKKGRKREVVYARKVLISILVDYGYTHKEINHVYNVPHDMCIFHRKTFNQIRPIDLDRYNACIEYYQLPVTIYNSVNAIDKDPSVVKMIDKILGLGRRDFKYFDNKIFKPFIRNLELEKSITEV